jgi:hypothetical protein
MTEDLDEGGGKAVTAAAVFTHRCGRDTIEATHAR